jgi:hypothetical protein
MPDPDEKTTADQESLPSTPLHAYKDGRKDEISGDADALESNDPEKQQARTLEGEDEGGPPEKH